MPLSYTDIKDFSIARAHGAALAETDVTTTPAKAAHDAEKMSFDRALGIALSGDAAHASMGEDHLGTGRFVYKQAKTQTAAFEHYPCGARYTASGTAPYHEFTGKPWDPDASLFYFPYRYYRPDMVRWTSADPLGLVDGPNVYRYVGNDPIDFIDTQGGLAIPIIVGGTILGCIIGGVVGSVPTTGNTGSINLRGALCGCLGGGISGGLGSLGSGILSAFGAGLGSYAQCVCKGKSPKCCALPAILSAALGPVLRAIFGGIVPENIEDLMGGLGNAGGSSMGSAMGEECCE